MGCLSQNMYCPVLNLLAILWGVVMPLWWDEVSWLSEALGCCARSLLTSQWARKITALGDPGLWSHGGGDDWTSGEVDGGGWRPRAGRRRMVTGEVDGGGWRPPAGRRRMVRDFVTLPGMVLSWNLSSIYFWNLALSTFRLWLTTGNWNFRKWNRGYGGAVCCKKVPDSLHKCLKSLF